MILPVLLTVLVLAPLGYLWQRSWVPDRYSAAEMGYADWGGGPVAADHASMDHHGGAEPSEAEPSGPEPRSVDQLVVDPSRRADVVVALSTRQESFVVGGKTIPGFTINGTSPGPTITARQGQLVEVRLHNESVRDGVSLHWHGLDVPNAMDGTAGVTQNEVPVGADFVYRFVADQVGTYWYHSHQVADAQVAGGLFGSLVVLPAKGVAQALDVTALSHTYDGVRTLNGQAGDLRVPAEPGTAVRLRLINSDNGSIQSWVDQPFTVLAVDGYEVHEPTTVTGEAATLTGGGRVDLGLTMPADGRAVRVQVSKGTAVILGTGDPAAPAQPTKITDLLGYGTPAPLGFDPATASRHFTYSIGHQAGFVRGRPGLWWSINGHLYPNVPMFMVTEGDVVVMHIDNHSGDVHPMHLHGHHAVVLSRNGVPATGSPWWVDTLNVADGETYDIAFVADNPGVWMDHCHNLTHAAQGMVAHLMYAGVTTPYAIGGPEKNAPE